MMETERRAAAPAPAAPSRYKTVRRKPAVATAIAQQPLQQSQPTAQVAPQQYYSNKNNSSQPTRSATARQRSRTEPVQTTLLGEAQRLQPHDAIRAREAAQQPETQTEHSSRFRKMLRINISSSAQKTGRAQPVSAPPSSHSQSKKLMAAPQNLEFTEEERRIQLEDRERELAREDAMAALEGKKKPSSQTRSRTQRPEKPRPTAPPDATVRLHFEKTKPTEVGIHTGKTDAEMLLEQVRPGHKRQLVEVWPSLGLERPVRYFEPVTDVTNTWDLGGTAHLKVTKHAWGTSSKRLEQFPNAEPPSGECLMYYYVQADKKWNTRTISLEGGTIRILKKDKPYDKDYLQTITMEYFDIYNFSGSVPEKKLKCPTRFCFAIKSQHRQSLFGKKSVFVHYFAFDGESLFIQWHAMIRDMKSRMIAEKKSLLGSDSPSDDASEGSISPVGAKSSPDSPPRGRRGQGPLISPEELAAPPSMTPAATDMVRSKSLHHSKSTKVTGPRNRSTSAKGTTLVGTLEEEVFSPAGLLGADYEEKRRIALKQYKEERSAVQNGFIANQTTLLGGGAPRDHSPRSPPSAGANSIHSSEGHGLLRRDTTPARPSTGGNKIGGTLLNFADDEVRAAHVPAHRDTSRRGRGHTISGKEGGSGALIDFATSSKPGDEPAAHLPTSLARRPTTGKKVYGHTTAPPDPFTGGGLLAGHYGSAGTQTTGHGVKTGANAISPNGEIRPLMDVGQRSMFAPGSLLERQEREMGPKGLVIDRDPHSSDSEFD